MIKSNISRIISSGFICICTTCGLSAQGTADYRTLYNNKEYSKSLEAIRGDISAIYEQRVEDKRVPTDSISPKKIEEGININRLFKNRKAGGFFEENNPKLHDLHLYAARNLYSMEKYEESLNHYVQSLRFKTLKIGEDDYIYYEIAMVFNKLNLPSAYGKALEAAYTLKPQNMDYSLLLGKYLNGTIQKKKAIFHLHRYIESKKNESVDPELLLMIGNLNEQIGRYIETEKYYKAYLKVKPDDGNIHYALGYLAYERTGNHRLARHSFRRALDLLPETEVFRRAKANEYQGDIYMKDLEYGTAVDLYKKAIEYQDRIKAQIDKSNAEITKKNVEINSLKSLMIKNRDSQRYSEYEYLLDEKGKLEMEKRNREYAFNKLNAGKIRWNMAESLLRMEKLHEAMDYYRQCIYYNYNPDNARDMIYKIQLKIKRGY